MIWIDSHAHLVSDGLYENIEIYKENARANDVGKILLICGNLEEVERGIREAEKDDLFDLAIGVHPTSVRDVSQKEFKAMVGYLDHPKVVAVGEIGLDYYWDDSYKEQQLDMFTKQLVLANEHDLPIIVHVRSSYDDIYRVLKERPVVRNGVIHCFSESVEAAQQMIDMGYYLGYGGILTFKNGDAVRDAFLATPKNRILTETDSPYLAPVPQRGKKNEPAFVKHVGEKMAVLHEMSDVLLSEQVRRNYQALFHQKD